jgi:hypothetical protein
MPAEGGQVARGIVAEPPATAEGGAGDVADSPTRANVVSEAARPQNKKRKQFV